MVKKILLVASLICIITTATACQKKTVNNNADTEAVKRKVEEYSDINIWELDKDLNEVEVALVEDMEIFAAELGFDDSLTAQDGDVFSDNVKEQLKSEFDAWISEGFCKCRDMTEEKIYDFNIKNPKYSLVEIDGVEGVHYSYQVLYAIDYALTKDDRVEMFLSVENGELKISKCWYSTSLRYVKRPTSK